MVAFGACSKMLRPWWDMQPRLVFEAGNRQLRAVAFVIGPTFGTASSKFPRLASWFWRTWTTRPGAGPSWVICTPPSLQALGCIGYLTNGAVRELPAVRTMGIQLFAGSVAVSRAYAHIFDFGAPVRVGGMEVHPGDLLHGDRHGVLTVPMEFATKIPNVAARLQQVERTVIDFCQSSAFSVAKLREIMKTTG